MSRAITAPHGYRSLSDAKLQARINRLAHLLETKGFDNARFNTLSLLMVERSKRAGIRTLPAGARL